MKELGETQKNELWQESATTTPTKNKILEYRSLLDYVRLDLHRFIYIYIYIYTGWIWNVWTNFGDELHIPKQGTKFVWAWVRKPFLAELQPNKFSDHFNWYSQLWCLLSFS
jgi:ribosomal protein RSM22 (predicted rRNA methylase)